MTTGATASPRNTPITCGPAKREASVPFPAETAAEADSGSASSAAKEGARPASSVAEAREGSTADAARASLIDMHCHLDHMANAEEVARAAAGRGIALFCATVSPADASAARARFAAHDNVHVGAGLHPWWIADGTCGADDIARAVELVAANPLVGEVGLDFGPRRKASARLQLQAFDAIARACAEHPLPGRLLSIHATGAADETLDTLERYGLTASATCIFHWFSGTSDQLARARRTGCLFSVNERMLANKRGRAYARQIPPAQLLLETDAPARFDTTCATSELERSLRATLTELARLHDADEEELGRTIAQTSLRLLA